MNKWKVEKVVGEDDIIEADWFRTVGDFEEGCLEFGSDNPDYPDDPNKSESILAFYTKGSWLCVKCYNEK